MLREIKTKNTLYKVNQMYSPSYFVEASSKEELFIFIADKVLKGAIINSVTEVRSDGSTPKVKVLSDKEFNTMLLNRFKTVLFKCFVQQALSLLMSLATNVN